MALALADDAVPWLASPIPLDGQHPTSPFTRLPWSIRKRIYKQCGILAIRGSVFINLNNSKGEPGWAEESFRRRGSQSKCLLLTCRTIYADVSRLVYSWNHFYIRFHVRNNLDSLRNLTTTSMRSLRHLTIHLNVSSCGLGSPCKYSVDPWERQHSHRNQDDPLSSGEARAQTILEGWRHTCQDRFRSYLETTDVRLHINFICDVADIATGRLAVQPFLDLPPRLLAGCSIRLSQKHDLVLQALADMTVATVTGLERQCIHPGSKSFRFLDLPIELQLHILSYTDLVTPHHEVEWNPSDGIYCRYGAQYEASGTDPSHEHGSPASTGIQYQFPNCMGHFYLGGCFCRSYHAASSSVHTCSCWAPPTSLFLVNRAMTEVARQVFYSANKFVIVRRGRTWYAVETSDPQLPISTWFNKIIPDSALQYLRYLEIVFPPFGEQEACTYCPPQSPEWLEWTSVLKRVARKLSLSQLTLSVCFATYRGQPDPDGCPPYRLHLDQQQCRAIERCYADIISPLKLLSSHGLHSFLVQLKDPSFWEENDRNSELSALEKELERMVMGDAYDAPQFEKSDKSWSRWQQAYCWEYWWA